MQIIEKILNRDPTGKKRSPKWRKVRKKHLKAEPYCVACGKRKKLQVHHIKPFHIAPELELEPTNLITLCTNRVMNCHLIIGHRRNFKNHNENVKRDAKWMYSEILGLIDLKTG